MRYNAQWDNAYGGAQLSWLAGTALHNAPEHVIFLEHVPFDGIRHNESVRIGEDALDRITKAFVRGEALHISSEIPIFPMTSAPIFPAPSTAFPQESPDTATTTP